MRNPVYYFIKTFYLFIGIQPFWLLHIFSDFLFLLLFHIIHYRKKVVFENLKNAFPEKSEQEIRKIARKFYHNFCDFLLETVKFGVISEKKLSKHITINNMELLETIHTSGKSVIYTAGHQFNWEWLLYLTKQAPSQAVGIYAALSNKTFEQVQFETRHRWNMILVPRSHGVLDLIQEQGITNQEIGMLLFSDQRPPNPHKPYWTIFLNQETQFFTGADRLSKTLDCPLVFIELIKNKRSYYTFDIQELVFEPQKYPSYKIIELISNRLEEAIQRHPDNWLWSHKRWKHKRPNGVEIHIKAEQVTK